MDIDYETHKLKEDLGVIIEYLKKNINELDIQFESYKKIGQFITNLDQNETYNNIKWFLHNNDETEAYEFKKYLCNYIGLLMTRAEHKKEQFEQAVNYLIDYNENFIIDDDKIIYITKCIYDDYYLRQFISINNRFKKILENID